MDMTLSGIVPLNRWDRFVPGNDSNIAIFRQDLTKLQKGATICFESEVRMRKLQHRVRFLGELLKFGALYLIFWISGGKVPD